MTSCCSFSRWAESFLDGELSPEHTIDFENHLPSCCSCNTRLKFERAVRVSTQRVVRNAAPPSSAFEDKLRALMTAERLRESIAQETARSSVATPLPLAPVVPIASATTQHRPLTWRAIAPLSVAAAAALVFAAMRGEPAQAGNQVLAGAAGGEVRSTDTMQTVRDFLDQLATDTEHNHEPPTWRPPYRTTFSWPTAAGGVNVVNGQTFAPPRLENAGAIWEGYHYRQVPVQGRISSWHYRVANHRVLLWVYDSRKTPLRAVLEARVAHNQAVFVGNLRGRAIAALERNGVGYAATTDLPQAQAAELVASLGNAFVH